MKLAESRPIKSYCLGIYDGPHATPQESSDGPIFLSIKNITNDGRLDFSEIRHVSEEEFPKWTRRVTPQADDVVFTYEATLHRYALIPEGFRGCLGRRIALVRPDPNQVDSRYLLYFFLSDGWRRVIEGNVISGATVDRIPLEKFPSFPAALPILSVQRKVAGILYAYDDLIENNRRRMVLLEEAGRQLYQEWFVRLRFPGHEHTRITHDVPEGWEVRKVSEAIKRIPAGKLYSQDTALPAGKVPILDQGKSGFIGFHDEEPSIAAGVHEPVIVFANHTCYQRIIFYPFSTIQNVLPFVSSPAISRNIFWLHFATCGLVRTNAYKGHWPEFMAKEILVPTKKLTELFGYYVKENLTLAYILELQNQKLRAARALLLPRLMSGEIAI